MVVARPGRDDVDRDLRASGRDLKHVPVRVGRLRHGHPRPEHLAPGPPPRLPHRPRASRCSATTRPRLLPLRPLLLARCAGHTSSTSPRWWSPRSARCRCSCSCATARANAWVGHRARRRVPPAPGAAVLHGRAVPPRGDRDHAAAVRVLLLGPPDDGCGSRSGPSSPRAGRRTSRWRSWSSGLIDRAAGVIAASGSSPPPPP